MAAAAMTNDLAPALAALQRAAGQDAPRADALRKLVDVGLPGAKSEEYKFTPVWRSLLRSGFEVSKLGESNGATQVAVPVINQLDAHTLVFVNGKFDAVKSNWSCPADEAVLQPLASAPTAIKSQLKDPFALLNAALWTDGLMLHVPAGSQVSKPILVLHLHDASAGQVSAHTRLVVKVDAHASVELMERSVSTGTNSVFQTLTEEIDVGEQGTFSYVKIQNDPGRVVQVNNTHIRQAEASRVDTFTLTLSGELVRNNLTIAINGEKCESHFHGLYLLDGNTLADNHTVVDHLQPHSFSNEMYKGVMDGQSRGVFNGKIFVRPDAQKTNAFQSNRNILLSDTATVNTKPQLEIWADDVKCSHGCTSGQLDEEAMFYLQSRGIAKATAQAMLLYAFAAETFQTVHNEAVRTFIDQLVAQRLHKDF
jgi:Fe-S cluster assembly protein SufD